jgi:hypothetical protein
MLKNLECSSISIMDKNIITKNHLIDPPKLVYIGRHPAPWNLASMRRKPQDTRSGSPNLLSVVDYFIYGIVDSEERSFVVMTSNTMIITIISLYIIDHTTLDCFILFLPLNYMFYPVNPTHEYIIILCCLLGCADDGT